MRLSHYFLPILKETPREAEIVSHRLMLRAGMIKQQSAGIFSFLPLGKKVLDKVCTIVREEQDRSGAIEILMPTIQSAELWRESGRYEAYGKEMLRIEDRHERAMLYGPTNEEMVTDIFRTYVRSYKDLPLNLYHIQWKFRDEVRPRFGVMRGREFLMKDAYSFDLDYESAKIAYYRMFVAYLRTFERCGLTAIPMRADTGPIGGDLSHEFIVLAETGESEVFCDRSFLEFEVPGPDTDFSDAEGLTRLVEQWTTPYAATDEMHDETAWKTMTELDRISARGIEVGHIFHFGTKYSEPMGAKVAGPDGNQVPVSMGSYGIGPTRLLGAIIEASHDEAGIIWPEGVAPFDVSIINMKVGDATCDEAAEKLYQAARQGGLDPLLDDTDQRAGAKFATRRTDRHSGADGVRTARPGGRQGGVARPRQRRQEGVVAGRGAQHGFGRRDQMNATAAARPDGGGSARPFGAFERMVAFRYLRARRKDTFVSAIAFISFVGITLGVATLIIVMAVMNGFRADMLNSILGVNGHLVVRAEEGPVTNFDGLSNWLGEVAGVTLAMPVVEGEVLASGPGGAGQGAKVRGLRQADLERVPALADGLTAGTLNGFDEFDGIAVTAGLASQIGVTMGDLVTLVSPNGDDDAYSFNPNIRAFPVVAIITTGQAEFDLTTLIMPFRMAQTFFGVGGASAIDLYVADPERVGEVMPVVAGIAGQGSRLTDWRQANRSLFDALQIERNLMFMVLALILIVAALNIISGLIMLVKDKGPDIGILRSIGTSRFGILRVFLMTGSVVGLAGTLAGFLIGIVFSLNIDVLRGVFALIGGENNSLALFLSRIPAELDVTETASVVVMALLLTLLASILPAWRAANLDPIEALRGQ